MISDEDGIKFDNDELRVIRVMTMYVDKMTLVHDIVEDIKLIPEMESRYTAFFLILKEIVQAIDARLPEVHTINVDWDAELRNLSTDE